MSESASAPAEGIGGFLHDHLVSFETFVSAYGLSAGGILLFFLMLMFWGAHSTRHNMTLESDRNIAKSIANVEGVIRAMEVELRRLIKSDVIPLTDARIASLREEIRLLGHEQQESRGGGAAGGDIVDALSRHIDAQMREAAERTDAAGERTIRAGDERMNRIESRLEGVSELVKARAREDGGGDVIIALRDKLERQSVYLHDEFAALAAKIDRLAEVRDDAPDAPVGGDASSADALESLTHSVRRLGDEINAKLSLLSGKLERGVESRWSDALGSISSLRARIEELAVDGERGGGSGAARLSDLRAMSEREISGEEDGRAQLSRILSQILPLDHFISDAELPGGRRADALVRFPDPRDNIAIDAGFAARPGDESGAFADALSARINYVADNLIAPPRTGENALLFISSESAFAEIHARHRDAVRLAQTRGVWLTSPSTLPAVVNTVNAAVRDHHAQRRLRELRDMAAQIAEEARHFENRIAEIGDHVNSAWRSVQRAESAGGRLLGGILDMSRMSGETAARRQLPAKNESDPS